MKLAQKIEVLANVATIAAILFLAALFIRGPFRVSSARGNGRHPGNEVHAGSSLPLSGVDWSKNGKTLLLVLNEGCHFCSESTPFYRHLSEVLASRTDVKLLAVLPQPAESAKGYLESIGVTVGEFRQASLDSLGVQGTPTLILADSKGVATEVWLGKLNEKRESEVFDRLACADCEKGG